MQNHLVRATAIAVLCQFVGMNNAVFGEAFSTHSRILFDSLNNSSVESSRIIFDEEYSAEAQATLVNGVDSELLYPGSSVSATNSAFAALNYFDFLGCLTLAEESHTTSGFTPMSSSADASVFWRDVVYVDGHDVGSMIRLVFTVKGSLEIAGLNSTSRIIVGWATNVDGWSGSNASSADVQLFGSGYAPGDGLTLNGWDAFDFVPGGFEARVHIDVPYDSNVGGYSWVLSLKTYAQTFGYVQEAPVYVYAEAASIESVGIATVTDIDGNPIAKFTFDSGLTPVPELPAMTSVAMVIVAFIAYRQFRASSNASL